MPYVWAWPDHPLLQEELNFAVLMMGLNGYAKSYSLGHTNYIYKKITYFG